MDEKAEAAKWAELRAEMYELIGSHAWDSYSIELEIEEKRGMNACVTGSKDDHDYWKGYVAGLRWAAHRPEKIIKTQGA